MKSSNLVVEHRLSKSECGAKLALSLSHGPNLVLEDVNIPSILLLSSNWTKNKKLEMNIDHTSNDK